jgi:hypothetical protein
MTDPNWIYRPPQYTPPAGYDPAEALLEPARRAGLLSVILGVLTLLLGSCIGMVGMIPPEQLPPDVRAEFEQIEAQFPSNTLFSIQSKFLFASIVILVPGILLIILGFTARRGGMGSIVALMVISILILLLLAPSLLGGLIGLGGGDPVVLVGTCVLAIPVALLGLQLWFLAGAVRAAPQIWMLRMQQQGAFAEHYQNQQLYRQPPPPPPPADKP